VGEQGVEQPELAGREAQILRTPRRDAPGGVQPQTSRRQRLRLEPGDGPQERVTPGDLSAQPLHVGDLHRQLIQQCGVLQGQRCLGGEGLAGEVLRLGERLAGVVADGAHHATAHQERAGVAVVDADQARGQLQHHRVDDAPRQLRERGLHRTPLPVDPHVQRVGVHREGYGEDAEPRDRPPRKNQRPAHQSIANARGHGGDAHPLGVLVQPGEHHLAHPGGPLRALQYALEQRALVPRVPWVGPGHRPSFGSQSRHPAPGVAKRGAPAMLAGAPFRCCGGWCAVPRGPRSPSRGCSMPSA
jgi:hypothetical protein